MSPGFLPLAEEGRQLLLREAGFVLVPGGALYFAASGLLGALGILLAVAVCFTLFFFRAPRFMPVEAGEGAITAPLPRHRAEGRSGGPQAGGQDLLRAGRARVISPRWRGR